EAVAVDARAAVLRDCPAVQSCNCAARESRAAGPSVEPDHGVVVDRAVVEAQVVVRAVIEEPPAPPVTAPESGAEVAEAVVDAAVVADMASPVASIPEVDTPAPTPVAGGPQRAHVGRVDPVAVHPVVAVVAV